MVLYNIINRKVFFFQIKWTLSYLEFPKDQEIFRNRNKIDDTKQKRKLECLRDPDFGSRDFQACWVVE